MINLGELLLLHRVGVSVPCRNGKPIGAIDEYGDMCVCCGSYTPEGRMICLGCEKGKDMKIVKKKKLVYVAGPAAHGPAKGL